MRLTFMAGREEPLRQLLAIGAYGLSVLVVISGFVADGWQWGALGVAVGVPGVVLPQVARRKHWSKRMTWLLLILIVVLDFGVLSAIAETPGT
jgi:bacteriorhodopsin